MDILSAARARDVIGNLINQGDDDASNDVLDEEMMELTPLYKLCLGVTPSSEGIRCAQKAGAVL
jgi:hypothetical protein